MHITYVLSAIGADQPGLVGRLSAVIADHGGNWLESRMAHLGGQFAGILRVGIPGEREADFLAALRALGTTGLSVQAHRDSGPAAAAGTLARIEVVGQDRPGIVRQISLLLAEHKVNVEELETHWEHGAMSGEMIFTARATVRLPPTCPLARLRQALEQIAADLMVDAAIMPTRPA